MSGRIVYTFLLSMLFIAGLAFHSLAGEELPLRPSHALVDTIPGIDSLRFPIQDRRGDRLSNQPMNLAGEFSCSACRLSSGK